MGARGVPPKPTALRVLQGNPGKIKINSNEPQSSAAPLDVAPPDWLDKEAISIWKAVRPNIPWLQMADVDALASYCNAYARVQDAERLIAREGPVRKLLTSGKKGKQTFYFQPNPLIAISRSYQSLMRAYGAELGLSPSARTRIHVEPPKQKSSDPARSFFAS